MRPQGWKRLSIWIGVLTLLAVVTAPQLVASNYSVKAAIQEPFELNGEIFDSGQVVLRQVSEYNPATTLNEVWVGRRCLGLMLAAVSDTPNANTADRMIFERNDAGTLVLVGFAYRGQPESTFYGYADVTRWSQPASRAPGVAVAIK